MIRSRHWMLAVAAGLLFAGHAAAVPNASFEIIRTSLTDTSVTYNLQVQYDDDDDPAGAALGFLQLDVADSSAALFAGNDFSRFTFTPGSPLANWSEAFVDPPGFGLDDSLVAYETFTDTDMLGEGTYILGTLSVDLTGLAAGDYLVKLAASHPLGGTVAGQEDVPGDSQTFHLIDVDVSDSGDFFELRPTQPPTPTPGVPEPGTVLLGALAAAALGLRRGRA